jgi:hypothetical protein
MNKNSGHPKNLGGIHYSECCCGDEVLAITNIINLVTCSWCLNWMFTDKMEIL